MRPIIIFCLLNAVLVQQFRKISTTSQATIKCNRFESAHQKSDSNKILSSKLTDSSLKMPEEVKVKTITNIKDFETFLNGYISRDQTLALLLDYDGTLAPIADHPSRTEMPAETEILLRRLAHHPEIFVAVISGRGINDVRNRVGLTNITYAGNHGLEIEHPDGTRDDYELPEEMEKNHKAIVKDITNKVAKNGAWLEDKIVSVTYHYRDTPEELLEDQRAEAIRIIEQNGYKTSQAHCAIEGKPPVDWHKGKAAVRILETHFGEEWHRNLKVIFAGDDTTDEDAMKALKHVGKSFRISADPDVETHADFRLKSPDEVALLLKYINENYV